MLEALVCESDKFAPWIDPYEKADVVTQHTGDNLINIVDCQCSKRDLFIRDCGGLDMAAKPLKKSIAEITEFVPVIPRDLFQEPPSAVHQQIVGISLKDILTSGAWSNSAGQYIPPRDARINTAALNAPIFSGKQVILFSGGIDTLIENLWWRRNDDDLDLFRSIAGMGFYAVTGLNLSLFVGECPLGQAININKTLLFCHELDKLGVNTVPNIYAVNNAQLDRWVAYLNANPSMRQVAINQQLQKDGESLANEHRNIRHLLENTNVSVLLQGHHGSLPPDLVGNTRIQHASSAALKRNVMLRNWMDQALPSDAVTVRGVLLEPVNAVVSPRPIIYVS